VSETTSIPSVPNTQPKALRFLANVVSVICHPVFMPTILAFVLSKLEPPTFDALKSGQKLWLVSIGLTTILYPLFSILLLKQLDFIKSYTMPTAKERTIPLMISMIFYFWVSHVYNNLGPSVPLILKVMLLGNLWGIVVVFIINIFTKISLHTTAAGGMIGVIIVLMMTSNVNMTIPLFASLIIAGVIGTARSILGSHQRGDIWLGYIIGILVQLGAYVYMK
jgi:hypothetical protein